MIRTILIRHDHTRTAGTLPRSPTSRLSADFNRRSFLRRSTPSVRRRFLILVACIVAPVLAVVPYTARPESETSFLAASDAAMSRMMKAMKIHPSGDVDRDFVAMMVPHHQGAIDMAHAVLEHGTDERLRRIAQEIIVTQQEEIVAMRRIVETLPGTRPSDGSTP